MLLRTLFTHRFDLLKRLLVSLPAVHHQREHGHEAPPRAPGVPGRPSSQRQEASSGPGRAGRAGPRAQRAAPGLVAPPVSLLPKSLVLARACGSRRVTEPGRLKRISRNQEILFLFLK